MRKLMLCLVIGIMIMLVGTVSASIGKVSTQADMRGFRLGDPVRYPSVHLADCGWLGTGCWFGSEGTALEDLQLVDNTDSCGEECSATKTITTYQDSPLIDDVRFYRITDEEETLSNIRSYQFYIQTDQSEIEVQDYEWQCVPNGYAPNGTVLQSCSNVNTGSHMETQPEWIPYTLGTVMPAGEYTVKLEGHKRAEWSYDWQIQSQGEWITEWAVWGGATTVVDTGSSEASSGADTHYAGVKLITNYAEYLSNVTTYPSDTSDTCKLLNDSNTELASSSVASNVAQFNYLLTSGTSYRVVCGSSGSRTMAVGSSSFPVAGTNINFTAGLYCDPAIANCATGGEERSVWKIGTSLLQSSVTLISPSDGYVSSVPLISFDCSASVIGANLVNISLWTNSTGTWHLNQTKSAVSSGDIADSYTQTPTDYNLVGRAGDGVYSSTSQSFMVSSSYATGNISLLMQKTYAGTDGTVTLSLFNADSSGNPTGAVLSSTTFLISSITGGGYKWYNFSLPSVNVIANSNYSILINETDAVTNQNAVSVNSVSSGTYATGVGITYADGVITGTGSDNLFMLYNSSSISPATFSLTITNPTKWTCQACDSDGDCGFASENRTVLLNTSPPNVTVSSPTGYYDYGYGGFPLTLNWSVSSNAASCWYSYNNTNTTVTCTSNSTTFNQSAGENLIKFYANTSSGIVTSNTTTWNYKVFENSRAYNASTYETASESYSVNVTTNGSQVVTANLIYNGVAYAATNSGTDSQALFTRVITIPAGTSSPTFYWNFGYGSESINSTNSSQTVNPILLGICNSTLDTPYINFTFKDQNTGSYLNASTDLATWTYGLAGTAATKSLIFTNTSTNNQNYAFCFSPPNLPMVYSLDYRYSFTGYPQQVFNSAGTLTNSTTNTVLWMIASADGIYSSIQIKNTYSSPVVGATVVAQRQFSGVWTTIGQATSDSSGLVTFFLNPNYDHQFTVSAPGYTPVVVTLRPTQSIYTVVLGSPSTYTNYTFDGISWRSSPPSGPLSQNTIYSFVVNITSRYNNLVGCKFELINETYGVLGSSTTGCSAGGGSLTVGLNTGTQNKIMARYYVDLGGGYVLLKSNDAWIIYANATGADDGGSAWVWSAINDFKGWNEWGPDHNSQEFSRIVFFFIALVICLGCFTFFTGYDFASPVASVLLVWCIVTIFSVQGFFTIQGITPSSIPWLGKYMLWMITTFISWGFLFFWWRREAG